MAVVIDTMSVGPRHPEKAHRPDTPILRKPEVTDRDVFVAPERTGLRRLDRFTGREVWTNRDTSRFLAATHNTVYALDRVGKFFGLGQGQRAALADAHEGRGAFMRGEFGARRVRRRERIGGARAQHDAVEER